MTLKQLPLPPREILALRVSPILIALRGQGDCTFQFFPWFFLMNFSRQQETIKLLIHKTEKVPSRLRQSDQINAMTQAGGCSFDVRITLCKTECLLAN